MGAVERRALADAEAARALQSAKERELEAGMAAQLEAERADRSLQRRFWRRRHGLRQRRRGRRRRQRRMLCKRLLSGRRRRWRRRERWEQRQQLRGRLRWGAGRL